MPPEFEAIAFGNDVVLDTTHTFSSPNITAEADRFLIMEFNATDAINSVTHNGQAMTFLHVMGFDSSIRVFGRVAPALGVNNVVTTSSVGVTISNVAMSYYSGVDQTTPTENFDDLFGGEDPLTILSNVGDVAIGWWTDSPSTTLAMIGPAGVVIRGQESSIDIMVQYEAPGAASVTFEYNAASRDSPRKIGCSLVSAVAGAPSFITSYYRHYFRG